MVVLCPSSFSQAINDYGAIASGAWTSPAIWRQWDGIGWNTVPATYPNSGTANVFITAGNTVTIATGMAAISVGSLTVETGAKLFTNTTATNAYFSIYGSNIVCDGEIGNGAIFDGIAFNFEGVSTTISGTGTFTASRFRKSAANNLVTTLIIAMNVTLRWDQASNTQLYNNAGSACRFNVTVNAGYTLNCAGSTTNLGNVAIDGVFGTGTADAGGTIIVYGTMLVPGTIYATTNNPSNLVYTSAFGTAGATTITVSQVTGLAVGQYVSGTGIANGATITAIAGTTVTLSIANTAAVSGAITVSALAPVTATGSVGSFTITVSNAAGLTVGQTISATGIAAGTTISAISGSTVTLSAANSAPVSGAIAVGNACNFIVKNGGLIRAGQVYSPSSTTLGFMNFTVEGGGKLEVNGAGGFPAGTANWTTINNRYNFLTNSTVEYSAAAAQSVLVQTDFSSPTAGNNQYWNLIISGSGIKTIRPTGPLAIRGNLTITGGSATLNQATNNTPIVIGGNWTNYNQSGFTESTNAACYVRFINNTTATQQITCPGGEVFHNFWIAKPGTFTIVELLDNVTVNSTLTLGLAGSTNNGILRLNQKTITFTNPLPSAIKLEGTAGVYRYIISEFQTFAARVNWDIGTNTGNYIIPFGKNQISDTIPFYYNKASTSDIGQLSVATYGTTSLNLNWPVTPVPVTNLLSSVAANNIPNPANGNTPDNRRWTIDRYWYLAATNPVPATAVFTYDRSELTDSLANKPLDMRAQYWDASVPTWQIPQLGNTGNAGYPTNSVKVDTLTQYNTNWTLSSVNSPLYYQVAPLPVELLTFDAVPVEEDVLVTWATASEQNNDYFLVERSADAFHYEPIGKVNGSGTTSFTHDYRFTDTQPLVGVSYYRLCQTDYDGTTKCYEPVVIHRTMTGKGTVSFWPNPATDRFFLSSNQTSREPVLLTVTDVGGREVISRWLNFSEESVIQTDISALTSGVYAVTLSGSFANQHFRLLKP